MKARFVKPACSGRAVRLANDALEWRYDGVGLRNWPSGASSQVIASARLVLSRGCSRQCHAH